MQRTLRLLTLLALVILAMVACSSNPSAHRPSRIGSSIDIARECQQLYGKHTTTIGKDGQPPTGWFCVKSNGRQAPFTVADMQRACDSQFKDAEAIHLSPNSKSGDDNSTWRCLPKQQTTPIT